MQIALIEPFLSGSHKEWAEGYINHSQHEILLFSLPGRHWKWRMHGGAVSLANQWKLQQPEVDAILCTDMLDISTFLALIRNEIITMPVFLYMHENQLTYPWSASDPDLELQRDRHYGFINFTSALTADHVFFNSHFHKSIFLDALPPFLNAFPDFRLSSSISTITQKSEVLPLGMDFSSYETSMSKRSEEAPLLILWNHRWEYDKNPNTFFNILFQLAEENCEFELVIMGESYQRQPAIFKAAKAKLAKRILHMGFLEDPTEYAYWLWQSDILPVTSLQDFFGISVVQAMYCQTYPLLPNRLAYPEHLPKELHSTHFYLDESDLLDKLRYACHHPADIRNTDSQQWVKQYSWEHMVHVYDQRFERLILKGKS